MSLLIALAAAAAITPTEAADIACVAQLALVADEQKHREGRGDYPSVGPEGAEYAAVVGADVMDTTGQTQEQVRDLILASAAGALKTGKPPRTEIDKCLVRMHLRLSGQ
ncbi:MAG: hypothetical protein JWL66_2715 [Sphingomonadales bacterium]|nr:hypothetical protein [Sphingomonadales bacterium]